MTVPRRPRAADAASASLRRPPCLARRRAPQCLAAPVPAVPVLAVTGPAPTGPAAPVPSTDACRDARPRRNVSGVISSTRPALLSRSSRGLISGSPGSRRTRWYGRRARRCPVARRAARVLARCSRLRAATWLMPMARAASAGVSPSHATSSSRSRSAGDSTLSAPRSCPRRACASSRASTASQSIPVSCAAKRPAAAARRWCLSTLAAMPYSHGSALPLSWATTRPRAWSAATKTSESRSSAAAVTRRDGTRSGTPPERAAHRAARSVPAGNATRRAVLRRIVRDLSHPSYATNS